MAPWDLFTKPAPDPAFPDTLAGSHTGADTAFEVFVDGALTRIYNEASGRAREQKQIREACKKVLDELRKRQAESQQRMSTPLDLETSAAVLEPLRLACFSDMPRLMEPALNCLHKLVAHAYLQAESSPAGRLTDDTLVARVISAVTKCGEHSQASVQLAVLQALLTATTAEHFVAHGDALMQAIRTTFNIAIGSENPDTQRTARGALLQMLNTTLKRVTLYPLTRSRSILGSMASSDAGTPSARLQRASTSGADGAAQHLQRESQQVLAERSRPSTAEQHQPSEAEQHDANGVSKADSEQVKVHPAVEQLRVSVDLLAPGQQPPDDSSSPRHPYSSSSPRQSMQNSLDPLSHPGVRVNTLEGLSENGRPSTAGDDELHIAAGGDDAELLSTANRTAQLASLAEQADIKGLEKALDAMEAERVVSSSVVRRSSSGMSQRDVRRVLMRDRRAMAWRSLLLPEKDVLTVFTAVCKMAARDTGLGAVEQYMHQGKLLALDLLTRVLSDPHHSWIHARPQFCEQLCQALCGAMLRNAVSVYDEAHGAAVRLLACVLGQPSLRASLKAEAGAFIPLLLLRPLEQERPDTVHLMVSLAALQSLCKQPQLMVDLFVNYDCDLQAANLFERVVRGISRVITSAPNPNAPVTGANGGTGGGAVLPSALKPRDAALVVLLAILSSLDEWAVPLQERSVEAAEAEDGEDSDEAAPRSSADVPVAGKGVASELAKFATQKEHKRALETGIDLFNKNAVKGINLLIKAGVLEARPEAVAQFLKEQGSALAPSAVGEYLGHQDDLPIAVMHAYVDLESFPDMTLDEALRVLLKGFRLPGEAQKIDRIMEKFAERYCRDNPDAFATADAAYLLAFALIMLNTDAHNPMADKKLSQDDFVNMCQTQVEGKGGFEPILPREDLEAMYERIIDREIVLPATGGSTGAKKGAAPIQGMRLAAAVGLTQLLLPFRAGEKWDKQHGVGVERAELVARTRDAVTKGLAAGHLWHVATHAEHARPMLQVAGTPVLRALKAAFDGSVDAAAAAPLLEGFATGIRLAGMLGLDSVGEAMVSSLADAAALSGEAERSSPAAGNAVLDGKRLAALQKLVELANGPAASFLGSGWVRILRTLSALDSLVEEVHRRSGQRPINPLGFSTPPVPSTPDFTAGSNGLLLGTPQAARASPAVKPVYSPAPHGSMFGSAGGAGAAANPLGRFLNRLGLGPGEQSDRPAEGSANVDSSSGSAIQLSGPDASLVMWAEGPGAEAIRSIYARSAQLNGDAVVVFVRALCAVSQEELSPADPAEPPRAHSLSRLIECGYHNLSRIRLIWRRVWAALSAHLVSAACHPDPAIAQLAVDHMRALVSKLLARAELSNFTHQDEALRPFVSVLRHCDAVSVRERCVQCIALALTAHPRGLGSGWRAALQALGVAAADPASPVIDAALDALQPVVEALWRDGQGAGHDHFADTIGAIAAAVRNPASVPLSVSAVHILQSAARRLAETPAEVWLAEPLPAELRRQLSFGLPPDASAKAEHPWGRVLGEMAVAARHDPRAEVADEAAKMLFETAQRYASTWDEAAWQAVHSYSFSYLLELPFPSGHLPDASGMPRVTGWSVEGQVRIQRHAAAYVPQLSALLTQHHAAAHPAILQQVLGLLVRYALQADMGVAAHGIALLQAVITQQAPLLQPLGWSCALKALSMAAASDALQLTALAGHSPSDRPPLPTRAFGRPAASTTEDEGLPEALTKLAAAAPGIGEDQSPAATLRARARAVLLVQKACHAIHQDCADVMPGSVQLLLLAILQDTMQRAITLNRSAERRAAAAHLLAQTGDEDTHVQGNQSSTLSPTPSMADVTLSPNPSRPESIATSRASSGELPDAAAQSTTSSLQPAGAAWQPAADAEADDFVLVDNSEAQQADATADRAASGRVAAATAEEAGAQADQGETTLSLQQPGQQQQQQQQQLRSRRQKQLPMALAFGAHTSSGGLSIAKPALLRQEAEGGKLLVTALLRCLASDLEADKGVSQEAQSRLVALGRKLLAAAADDAWSHQGRGPEGAASVLAPEGSSWEEAIRAPLLVAVLQAYAQIADALVQEELRNVFPHLARLICCAQPSVRSAVAGLLHTHLPSLLPVA